MENYIDRMSTFMGDMSRPLIIEVQPNGPKTKDFNPNVPIGHEEITREAILLCENGASMFHVHNTDVQLKGEAAADDYMKSWRTVMEKYPDVIWDPTMVTNDDPSLMGLEHVEVLFQRGDIRIGLIDPGITTINFAKDDAGYPIGLHYGYSMDQINQQVQMFKKYNKGVVFGIYEPSYLRTAALYINNGMAPDAVQIDYYMIDEYGLMSMSPMSVCGMPATFESLYYYRWLTEYYGLGHLPWALSIFGAGEKDMKPLMKRAIEMGGDIKVGMDSHYSPTYKPTNLELLVEAKALAAEVGRPVATPKQAAELLGI